MGELDVPEAVTAGQGDVAERLMREHMTEYVTAVTEREPYLMDEVVDWR